MMVTGDIINHNSQNEMTSEISTIAPDLTLIAESEKTISTEPKFGFFDRQMAELEPKVYYYLIFIIKAIVIINIIFNLFIDRALAQVKINPQ